MNVLVTGASGFLGQTLCQALAERQIACVALSSKMADLRQSDALRPWNDTTFDRIFHLAAWTQAGDFCLRHPGEQWIINQQINTTVLAWWQQRQPQAKMIAIGTSCAYDPALPLSEDHYMDGRPIDSLFTYAMTKRMLYAGLCALQQQFGLRYLCVVPSTLYGPEYHTDGRQLHFIFDLMRKIIRGKKYGEPVVLWGDGHQRRELVLVDDFVRVLLDLAERADNDLVNIGAGVDYSIRDFAAMICQAVDYPPERIQYDATRYVGATAKCLQIEKLRQLAPQLTYTPLDEGLRNTVQWFFPKV